jgi:hypothetical protein
MANVLYTEVAFFSMNASIKYLCINVASLHSPAAVVLAVVGSATAAA